MTEKSTHWSARIKQVLVGLALAGIGFSAGLYLVAPSLAKAEDGYLPKTIVELPAGAIQLTNPDGSSVLLPVRLAETADARRFGLREAGPKALDTLFMVYAHPREMTRTSYNTEGIRVALELAVIDAEGTVVAVKRVDPGTRSVSVAERHRWLLVAKEGLLSHYGIAVESVLDTENIRKKEFVVSN